MSDYKNHLDIERMADENLNQQANEFDGHFSDADIPVIDQLHERIAALEAQVSAAQEVVKAARDAKLQIEYLHEKFQETGTGNAVLAKLNAALAAAERVGAK